MSDPYQAPRVAFLPLRPDQTAKLTSYPKEEKAEKTRTVICSVCGATGHNKRTCPKEKP